MDHQLISKILRFSAPEPSSTIETEHPLLDPASCRALSTGLVRLLHISTAAPLARTALLRNIRALTTHTHHPTTQNLIQIITEYYARYPRSQQQHTCKVVEEQMSFFLASQLENIKLENRIDNSVVCLSRVLLNTDPENPYIDFVTKIFLTYDDNDRSINKFLREVWNKDLFTNKDIIDRLCMKVKPDIERTLLNASYSIISNAEEVSNVLDTKPLKNLVNKSSKSRVCFQMCCRILNSLFIRSKYHLKIQILCNLFVENVKLTSNNFIALYDDDLQCLTMMMACDEVMKSEHIINKIILEKLKEVRAKSEDKFLMLMSHNSHWFDNIIEKNIMPN